MFVKILLVEMKFRADSHIPLNVNGYKGVQQVVNCHIATLLLLFTVDLISSTDVITNSPDSILTLRPLGL